MPHAYRTIGQVAALTGLTVRAMHHYDAIGLVCPSHRSAAGYRLYTGDDLHRLQQVLLLRELGFGLDAVRDLIEAPASRKREALLAQRTVLEQQRRHADAVLRAVDATLQSLETDMTMNNDMSTEHLFDGYQQFQNGEYASEAENRWGDTDAWKISRQRTGGYSKEDWARIAAEANAITSEFLASMQRHDAPHSDSAAALAERHREHIEHHFYPCSHGMHACVAAMYTADARFQAHYDMHANGLAAYIEAAVRANADRHGTNAASSMHRK
jgi:MerR family transcriptional regulator, thiopeptide resistance regulator